MTRTLRTAQLGTTGLQITRVGFGAWAIGGGGWEFGWGPQDDDQSIAAIHRALELGVNWIDTAAAYGFGRSEEVVGRGGPWTGWPSGRTCSPSAPWSRARTDPWCTT
jgi:aryl-alcohol dehydrogenase-like predicted oxidoreductase